MLVETDIFGVVHDKVATAIDRIKCFEPKEGYYVAFSGGKDSVVILDLVKRSGVKYDAHYNITGIDPPELYYFIRDQHPEVQRHRSEMTMWALIVHKGMPPTRIARYCCNFLKERGGKGRFIVTGVRWGESVRRSKRKMTEACYKDTRRHYLHPIIDWSHNDVWDYIYENNISYCHLYDEGFKRLGCIGCPNGNRVEQFKRWPKYEQKYKEAFYRLAESGKFNAASGHASIFDWWMSESRHKDDPDQTVIFE